MIVLTAFFVACSSARNPVVAKALIEQAAAHISATRFSEAIAMATQIIEDDPKNVDAYYMRGRASYLQYVQAYYRGDPALTGAELLRPLADFSKITELRPDLAEAYDYRAMIYTAQGEYERALADFNTALRLQPAHSETYYGRGELYERLGRYPDAIADFRRFIQYSRDEYWRNKAWQKIHQLEHVLAAST